MRHEVGVGENQRSSCRLTVNSFRSYFIFHHRTYANRGQLRRIGKDARFLDDFRDFLLDHLRSFGRIRIVPMMRVVRAAMRACGSELEQVVEQAGRLRGCAVDAPKRFQRW